MLDVMNILAVTANNFVNNWGVLLQGEPRQPLHLPSKCPYRLNTFVEMIIHGSNGTLILFFWNKLYFEFATYSLRIFSECGYGGNMFSA